MRSERILENGVSLVRFFLLLLVLLLQAVEWRGGKPIPTYFLLAGELLLHDSSWSVILLKQNAFFYFPPASDNGTTISANCEAKISLTSRPTLASLLASFDMCSLAIVVGTAKHQFAWRNTDGC